MKNMTKKIMALAMIVGFTNISAEKIPFYSSSLKSSPDGLWNKADNTAQITSGSKTTYYIDVTQNYKSQDSEYENIGVTSKVANHAHTLTSNGPTNKTDLYGIKSKIDITGGNNVRIGTPSGFTPAANLNYTDAKRNPVYVFIPVTK